MTDHLPAAMFGEYLAGELDGEDTAVFERHLSECLRCVTEIERSQALMSGLRSLPTELIPQRDLRPRRYPEAKAGSSPRRARLTGRRVWSAAAGLAFLLAGSWTWLSMRGPDDRTELDLAYLPVLERETAALAEQLRAYESASRRLVGELERHRGTLPAAADRVVATSLASIERAIARTASVVREFPEDRVVQRMLLDRYENKMDLIRRTLDIGAEEW